MMRRLFAVLFAAALMAGQAPAAMLAISPLGDQPERKDFAEPAGPAAAPNAADRAKRELPANPLWAIPLKQLSSTRERPIFSPSRRPPPAAVMAAPAAAPRTAAPIEPRRPRVSLIGTVIGERESIGVFVDETNNNTVRLRRGEEHRGWTLTSVQGREVTFERNGDSATFGFPKPNATPAAQQESANPRAAQRRR